MNKRLKKFESIKNDPWFGKIYSRLSTNEIELIRKFITENDSLNRSEFEFRLNRLFLDMTDKPKRWREITELLMISNTD